MAKEEPVKIYENVSKTQLSIAVHYGGAMINGNEYVYLPEVDRLVLKKYLKQYKKDLLNQKKS